MTAAQRTLAVFEVFAREKRELSNSDMARLLGVADSSSHDLLNTLHELGFLMRLPSKHFYPTTKLFEIARKIAANDPIVPIARKAVSLLAERTGESAVFGVRDGSAGKIIATQPGGHRLHYHIDVGERVALHASGFGKALLGQLDGSQLEAVIASLNLRKLNPNTLTDARALIADVRAGQRRGWYEARGEGTEGVTSLAVSGLVGGHAAALSLVGPSDRVEKQRDAYVKALGDVGREVFPADSFPGDSA